VGVCDANGGAQAWRHRVARSPGRRSSASRETRATPPFRPRPACIALPFRTTARALTKGVPTSDGVIPWNDGAGPRAHRRPRVGELLRLPDPPRVRARREQRRLGRRVESAERAERAEASCGARSCRWDEHERAGLSIGLWMCVGVWGGGGNALSTSLQPPHAACSEGGRIPLHDPGRSGCIRR
jgi:hypothetical protein